jgi:hypothetical protein
MASTYLQRTPSTTGNRKKWTWSAWIKRSNIGTSNYLLSSYESSSTETTINFNGADQLDVYNWYGSAYNGRKTTSMRFRDTNAWYHIVVNLDLDHATADDRFQIYVNGERITSFASGSSNPTSGSSTVYNLSGINMKLGTYDSGNLYKFDGYMAHVHWVDGLQLDADTFGETDSTTGIWKPKTSPTISDYGTNGFFLDFASSSTMGNDVSGKNNDLTVNGTMTQTIDTPSNVFATWNPNHRSAATTAILANKGNLTLFSNTTSWSSMFSTLAFSQGKYYWEVEVDTLQGGDGYSQLGIQCFDNMGTGTGFISNSSSAGMELDYRGGSNNNLFSGGSNLQDTGVDWSNGDIAGFACDMDNKALYIHKNGTYVSVSSVVGVPTSGSSKTGAITIPASVTLAAPAAAIYGSNVVFDTNFGNGYFGTTAVSSAGSNSGLGTFEFDVPTGFKALCTKNLNEQEYS